MRPFLPAQKRAAPVAAILCLTVSWIHVQDQGGFPGGTSPRYIGISFYVLEAAGLATAIALVTMGQRRSARAAWLAAVGVGLGPLIGYLLSRGPGLPYYGDDRGNWTEPLGIASLAVEATLVTLAATVLLTTYRLHERVSRLYDTAITSRTVAHPAHRK